MEFIQIEVAHREERGTKQARRLRHSGVVPAVLYGLGRRNLPLSMSDSEVDRFLKSGSHLIELRLGDETRPAIVREIQIDALTDRILHIDFIRVDKDADIEDDVRLVYKGEAAGVKEGGLFTPLEETLRVRCRPNLIPREIVIDINGLGIGDAVFASEVSPAEGVTIVTPPETVLANVQLPKAVAEEPEEGEADTGDAPADDAAATGDDAASEDS